MSVKFSIITATFNAVEVFDRTLSCIENQTCKNFEWIVIDGASTDGTIEKIKKASHVVNYYLSEKDKGIADAWNKGIKIAKGEYILLLNAGDCYDDDFIEQMNNYTKDNDKIISCNARIVSEKSNQQVGVFISKPQLLYRGMHVPHNFCAVKRDHYEQIGLYKNLMLSMDFEWFHRYYKIYGKSGFLVINKILGSYYLGGISDLKYIESFKTNEKILIENKTNVLLAKIYFYLYSFKHFIKHRLINFI